MNIRNTSASSVAALLCALLLSTIAPLATAANFPVTVTKTGTGFGTITSNAGAINCGSTCVDGYAEGSTLTLTASPAAGSQFVGWLGPCIGTAQCQIVVSQATTASATFAKPGLAGRPFDVDGNNAADALTDGLLIIRSLFGLNGSQLVGGAIGPNATRGEASQIAQYLTDIQPLLDIDGNGRVDALSDGLLILRYMFGLRGPSLTANAVASDASFTDPGVIQARIQAAIDTVSQAADLTIAKSHTGNFRQGDTGASYTITVSNAGSGPTVGTVTVTDNLPTGLTATGISGTGWSCTLATRTCTRSDALAGGANYPAITLTASVASNAPASVTNTVTVSGGGEINTANNTASDPTTITQAADLTIAKSHTGNFRQGDTGASYTITVSNMGSGPTVGTVTVTDNLPTGLTATGISGTGWSCTLATRTCTRSDALAGGANYPAITLTASVASNAPASLTNTVTVSGGGELNTANNTANDPTTITQPLPPDPASVAPPSDSTTTTSIFLSTQFLYTGPNPIQTGVAAGVIAPVRVAVVRGTVRTRDSAALSNVIVSLLDHPELGQTQSRADGGFDLAVNGGGMLVFEFRKAGFLSVQRQVNVGWQSYVSLPDVVMTPLDPAVTTIGLNAGAIQVARGSTVTDSDGTRRATVLFPQGTTATIVLADGTTQPLTSLNVRATEYTVGPNGPGAMPGVLPPSSGYTYAVELSADEAISANARSVVFNQPVFNYVENFLNFPVGDIVPSGYFDRVKSVWVASQNGRVIQITSIAGGLAVVDTVGSGALPPIVLGDAERQQLAQLYSAGQKLWRVPITHFTPWDLNWPYAAPDDAKPPNVPDPTPDDRIDDPNCSTGSIIECENQALGQRLALTGVPFSLNYRSTRVPDRTASRRLRIPLSGAPFSGTPTEIALLISVGGRTFQQTLGPIPNMQTTFNWDGKDAYGRKMQGRQKVHVDISYAYDGVYVQASNSGQAFARPGGVKYSTQNTRVKILLNKPFDGAIGSFDARGIGLGGWTPSVHHVYDPEGRTLLLGNGRQVSSESVSNVITTVAGQGLDFFFGEGSPATAAGVPYPRSIAMAPDGGYYIAAERMVLYVDANGIVSRFAGNGRLGVADQGDGGPATQAPLTPSSVALAPDGSLYVANSALVRRVGADGIIRTVVGTLPSGFAGDGGPASQAKLADIQGIAFGPDGSLYIAARGNGRIRRVGTDGIITTIAGGGPVDQAAAEGIPATQASLNNPNHVAVGPDGSVYIGDVSRVRRITPDGIIKTVAGTGSTQASNGDGLPATQTNVSGIGGIAVRGDGTFYFGEGSQPGSHIRRVGPDGIMNIVAGSDTAGSFDGDGKPATQATFRFSVDDVAIAPDGALLIADFGNNRVRRLSPVLPGFSAADIAIPSDDGRALYRFNDSGRHLQTRDTLTGAVLYEFGYDATGLLTQVIQKTGGQDNITTIQRDSNRNPTAIVGPFGQKTTLAVDANGFLAAITAPGNLTTQIASTPGGLMTSLTNPRGKTSSYTFDGEGLLIGVADAAGGTQTLSRNGGGALYDVSHSTKLGRTTVYKVRHSTGGARTRTITSPDGLDDGSQSSVNSGGSASASANGTTASAVSGPDPRFGMQVPIPASITIQTPGGGPALTATRTRTAVLGLASDPLSLQTLTDTTTVDGKTTTSVFQSSDMTQTTTSPLGRKFTITLDTMGRPTSKLIAGLNGLSYTYDSRGRALSVSQGSGPTLRTMTFAYDSAGYLTTITDALGRTAQFAYDAAGRLISKTFPDGQAATFTYDAAGNMTSLTPPGRTAHAFAFSDRNELVSATPPSIPGAGATAYTYNADRQLTLATFAGGRSIAFAYNAGGRLSTRTLATGSITDSVETLTYDGQGHVTSLAKSGGIVNAYSYTGSLVTGVSWTGPIVGAMSRTHDTQFRVASEAVNGADSITFSYDNDSLLISAGDLTITRNAQNSLATGIALGVVNTTMGYDGFGEMTSYAVAAGATPLLTLGLTRDALGRIAQKAETIGGVTDNYSYTYSVRGRVTGVSKNGAPVETYVYDVNGNRTSATIAGSGSSAGTYDAQDRLLQYGTATYAYSGSGELLTKSDGGQTTNYSYDQRGNLLGVALPGGTSVTYVVDANDRRIGKKVNGTLVKGLVYRDKLHPIAELDGTNTVISRFIYAGGNSPAYMVKGGVRLRFVTDTLGSVRMVVDSTTGAVVQRIDYDTFGNVTQDTNQGFQPFGFAGGLYDPDTGLVRFGARDYDPKIGRWTAKDPIQFRGGDTNLYAYVSGDPVNLIDPKGANGQCSFDRVAGSAVGFIDCTGVRKAPPPDTGQSLVPPTPDTPEPEMCSPETRAKKVGRSGDLFSDLDTGQSCSEGFIAQHPEGEKNETVCSEVGSQTSVPTAADAAFPEAWKAVGDLIGADVPKVTGGGSVGGPRG